MDSGTSPSNQIAPIVVYNPRGSDDESRSWGTCLCCGEDAQTYGMCLKCANANCQGELDEQCRRTGVTDPKHLAVPDTGADILESIDHI